MPFETPKRVWEHTPPSITQSDRLTLVALASFADDSGICWPGHDELARMVGINARSIDRVIDKLEQAGQVYVLPQAGQCGGRGNTNVYLIATGLSQDEMAGAIANHWKMAAVREQAEEIAAGLVVRQKGVMDNTHKKRNFPKKSVTGNTYNDQKGVMDNTHINEEKGVACDKKGVIPDTKGVMDNTRTVIELPSNSNSSPNGEDGKPNRRKKGKAKNVEKKVRPPLSPAFRVFVQHAQTYGVTQEWRDEIARVVGDDPVNLEKFGEFVKDWCGCGYNPTHVNGLLECFKRGELPSAKFANQAKQPGLNGHAKPASTITGLQGRAIDDPIQKRCNIKTGETYWFDLRTNQRVPDPEGT